MKTAVKWLEEYLNTKVLPCPEDNDYVYGMNVAHENLINYVIPALLEKEKKQIIDAYEWGLIDGEKESKREQKYDHSGSSFYEDFYHQNK